MGLLNLIHPELIALHLNAKDAQEVIAILSSKLVMEGYVCETFAQAALEREAKLPTGLPLSAEVNAAIPHTDIEHVIKPAIAIATLNEAVGFRNMVSPDEIVDVRLVFVMALDRPKAQIEMLQEIAGLLQDPEMILRLMEVDNFEGICSVLNGGNAASKNADEASITTSS